jgi:hypothetical protein
MRWSTCSIAGTAAEDDWNSCDGGREALEALTAYRAQRDGERGYRMLRVGEWPSEIDGDEIKVGDRWMKYQGKPCMGVAPYEAGEFRRPLRKGEA